MAMTIKVAAAALAKGGVVERAACLRALIYDAMKVL
jgi:hypothetical protein